MAMHGKQTYSPVVVTKHVWPGKGLRGARGGWGWGARMKWAYLAAPGADALYLTALDVLNFVR